jgi:broad-specificity NMP kinase
LFYSFESFFYNPQSLLWLIFIQSLLKIFCKAIKEIESKNVSASEVAEEADLLVDTISRRKEENFQTTQITTLISELENRGLVTESEYLKTVNLVV